MMVSEIYIMCERENEMSNIKHIQVYKDNQDLYDKLLPMWIAYFDELYEHQQDEKATTDEIIHDLKRRINNQGARPDMHFEMFFCDDILVGFAHFAVVKGGSKAGCGFVMEFYVTPYYRRKGYGKLLYEHIEKTLKQHGVNEIFLTSDTSTGVPFWVAMGFNDSGNIDPDNNMSEYIKKI